MSVRATVYVETSVVSYLTARPSRDLVCAAQQQLTAEWWQARTAYDLYVSQLVLDEIAVGDAEAAARRLAAASTLPLLELTPAAVELSKALVRGAALPPKADSDALHVALAAVHGMSYLLTWNCTHIANALMRTNIEALCRSSGFEPPVICTPLELVQE